MSKTVDLIILSNAINYKYQRMTQKCVDSVNDDRCEIIVMEQNLDVTYKNCYTYYINEKFNYNRFANHGAKLGRNEWIMIANNDLIFYRNWLDPLLNADHLVLSPKCPNDKRQKKYHKGNHIGWNVGEHLSGWCFMIRRDLWELIGGFDEDFPFWCADNSFMEQLKIFEIPAMLVTESKVQHLGTQTLVKQTNIDELTKQQVIKFNKKYNKNLFGYGQC